MSLPVQGEIICFTAIFYGFSAEKEKVLDSTRTFFFYENNKTKSGNLDLDCLLLNTGRIISKLVEALVSKKQPNNL